ncbi:MAG TPA: hypothetical protein VMA73_09365 [Streptosporangiaceae bacterium]|nr:hypothetical protein [Streptosporangiaceae bacterium]
MSASQATVTLSLSGDNQKALGEFVAARREQGIFDLSQMQRTSAIRDYFADPAFVPSWWLDRGGEASVKMPKVGELQEFMNTLNNYPRIVDTPIEYQVLDLLRAFIEEFPEQHQKHALLTLLSNGFDRAGAHALARRAESLASDESPDNGTRPVP